MTDQTHITTFIYLTSQINNLFLTLWKIIPVTSTQSLPRVSIVRQIYLISFETGSILPNLYIPLLQPIEKNAFLHQPYSYPDDPSLCETFK